MERYSNLSFEELHDLLETLHDRYNRTEFIEPDPISIPHSFERAEDKEIAGFLAAQRALVGLVDVHQHVRIGLVRRAGVDVELRRPTGRT